MSLSFLANYGGITSNPAQRQRLEDDVENTSNTATNNQQSRQSSWRKKVQCILDTHYRRTFGVSFVTIVTAFFATLLYCLWTHVYHSDANNTLNDDQCVSDRNWPTTLFISICFGSLGADRFYLGYTYLGVLKAFTEGLNGIWWAVDVVLILLNEINDYPNGCQLPGEMTSGIYSFLKEMLLN
ncbi:hypothetical protein BDA99DRAFT_441797 [Phascolomyces articulosus]|uniref:TM2 domain-containing protein n=1 Tax=Phascolomyces articulosus TaxID=60185 RepID=A0AAD5K8Y8_9FUNG|nr:hypothetical protein BDA99DRAFT_441797 [Phascolomyces articulosus]